MTLHRKHWQLAERIAAKKHQGMRIIYRIQWDAEHWKLYWSVYAGGYCKSSKEETITSAETKQMIQDFLTVFSAAVDEIVAEKRGELVGIR